jgi:diguanylate cyclase (GGDEF)-like protein
MVDIDHLAQINDQYGNAAGDEVMSSIAAILSDALRMPDRVGRYNGNEFLIVLPETALDDAERLAERVRQNTANSPITVDGNTINTTISVGVTQFRRGEDLEQLISRAEQAIQSAKQAGRNCVIRSAA